MHRPTICSTLSRFAIGACVALAALGAAAADFPSKPIKLLVGFPPGGGTDMLARAMAAELTKSLGQQVVVENKGGANGVIATTELSKAAPDGHTLMMTISSHVTNALLYSNLTYKLKDFQPVTVVATSPFVLIAHPQFAPNDVKSVIAAAKAGEITFASPGPGSTQHLSMELLNVKSGVKMTHIPYRGGAPALTDLLGGQVPMMFMTTVQSLPFLKDKRVKALAVSTPKRTPVLPDVPTIAESGVDGYASDVWFGVIAPAGTPASVVAKLHEEIVRIVKSPAMQANFAAQGAEPVGNTPAEFAAIIDDEYAKWGDVIKRTGIKAQ
jgi:tripartite-type tricarboxylate transporter receptor subunit TctC